MEIFYHKSSSRGARMGQKLSNEVSSICVHAQFRSPSDCKRFLVIIPLHQLRGKNLLWARETSLLPSRS